MKIEIPKFKWNKKSFSSYCLECNKYCEWECHEEDHDTIRVPRIPFFVLDMKIVGFVGHWVRVKSEALGQEFFISPAHFKKIAMKHGIDPDGNLPNRWWIIDYDNEIKQVV